MSPIPLLTSPLKGEENILREIRSVQFRKRAEFTGVVACVGGADRGGKGCLEVYGRCGMERVAAARQCASGIQPNMSIRFGF